MYIRPITPDELYHSGVRGMHWGQRKEYKKQLKAKRYKKESSDVAAYNKYAKLDKYSRAKAAKKMTTEQKKQIMRGYMLKDKKAYSSKSERVAKFIGGGISETIAATKLSQLNLDRKTKIDATKEYKQNRKLTSYV